MKSLKTKLLKEVKKNKQFEKVSIGFKNVKKGALLFYCPKKITRNNKAEFFIVSCRFKNKFATSLGFETYLAYRNYKYVENQFVMYVNSANVDEWYVLNVQ